MYNNSKTDQILGLGLNNKELEELNESIDSEYEIYNCQEKDISELLAQEKNSPLIALLPWRLWKKIPAEVNKKIQDTITHRVLLLNKETPNDQINCEELFAEGFLSVLKTPLCKRKISEVINQATEVDYLYQDIYSMTREIELERELLARKNQQLSFLNLVLTRATESLDPARILYQAQKDLGVLFPVQEVNAIFWEKNEVNLMEAELYFSDSMPTNLQNKWINFLLDKASKIAGKEMTSYHSMTINSYPGDLHFSSLKENNLIVLPLTAGSETFGTLVIASSEASQLGKDRLSTLKAAVNHLSLALRNALLFRKAKNQADHDGLTKLYNRQHFDKRIIEELKRHQRHHQELSLLMLDLDHFKEINDTFGHQAGDMVLEEVGVMLKQNLRETDFPARYGGEEFTVILPQTSEEQAWILAERIRKKVAQKSFQHRSKNFQVTISIGVAGIRAGSLYPAGDLVNQADQALYAAKHSGRNMVCRSARQNPTLGEAMEY